MTLLDRHILSRFLANFVILFALLFLFAASIDLVLALDEFVEAAEARAGADAGSVVRLWTLIRLSLDFQLPRIFQFYGFLHAIVAVGAMGFTLARMHKARELVAMLAAGIGMTRIAMPFVVGTFVLGAVQLVNQELFLPRVAPMLIRDHDDIGRRSIDGFPVRFTRDVSRALIQSPRFDPEAGTLATPTILERDQRGRTVRRITADSATWETVTAEDGTARRGWRLENGEAVRFDAAAAAAAGGMPGRAMQRDAVDFFETELSPQVLVLRRHGEYASMLSSAQINEILAAPGGALDRPSLLESLARYRYGRFSNVLVDVLLMWLALPAFLLRGPANLLVQSLKCAAITLPAVIASAIFMLADLPGVPPAASVFLPALMLLVVVVAQWTTVKT